MFSCEYYAYAITQYCTVCMSKVSTSKATIICLTLQSTILEQVYPFTGLDYYTQVLLAKTYKYCVLLTLLMHLSVFCSLLLYTDIKFSQFYGVTQNITFPL